MALKLLRQINHVPYVPPKRLPRFDCRVGQFSGRIVTVKNVSFLYFPPLNSCPQSEAYEKRQDPNGMYMKHLLKHIMKDSKIEDVLHRVAGGNGRNGITESF